MSLINSQPANEYSDKLAGGNIRDSLFYRIGELVLVVIVTLIDFQINKLQPL